MKRSRHNSLITGRAFIAFMVVVVAVFSFLGALYWKALLLPAGYGKDSGEVSIVIPENATGASIGEMLYKKGLVRGPDVVTIYARLNNVDQKLKPGRYILNRGQSVPEIVSVLVAGSQDRIKITVPEGYSLSQLEDLLAQKGLVDRGRFRTLISEKQRYKNEFIKKIPQGEGLEGYLFPDTYHIGSGTTEEEIVGMMLDRFEAEIMSLDYERKALEKNLTLHEAVTVASMIEGEAAVNEERQVIAGVIYNRLRMGMPLQIDATVKYALGGQPKKIYYKDLEVNSPYNTYRVSGLPPGPISSPGRASLLAALNPAKTEYLYYVAKPDGTHAFSSSLEEHNINRKKYQE
ncbi:MAG: endolytic transglycosylase MltG [Bacillota bacterium]